MDKNIKTNNKPLSDNERLKLESNYLRGTIAEDLKDELNGGFNKDNFQLIRFHGMYEQDDRDVRAKRLEQKLEPLRNVMLRCRITGGIIYPKGWLEIDKFAKEKTLYGSIRLTTRQTFQFHGVLKPNIKPMHQLLNQLGLDSIATAGDVNRNVLCSSNPSLSRIHKVVYDWAVRISEHLLPKTNAYAEIWLDKEKVETVGEVEPILGKTYLPRKFKTAIAIPPDNDVDVYGNDLSFIAVIEKNELIGFNVLVGGGLSLEHGNKKTYPNTSYDFGFVTLDDVLAAAEGVVIVQRDFGNRSDRKNARTRYTLQNLGIDNFKKEVEKRMNIKFLPTKPYTFTSNSDYVGWKQGENGNFHLTLFIENGRIIDTKDKPIKSGIREIAKIHQGEFRLTANQNLIVANIHPSQKAIIEEIAKKYKLIDDGISNQRKNSIACVALPTCPLAMAESERFAPGFITELEKIMHKYNLDKDYFIFRVSGCPNGCSRAMLAEVALLGKAIGRYNLYIGGNKIGSRIPRMVLENKTVPEILEKLEEIIALWAKYREKNEDLGDFVIRKNIITPVLDAPVDFWGVKELVSG